MAETKEVKKKAPGVIKTLEAILSRKEPSTLANMVKELEAKFPDHAPESLLATVRTQLSRNGKKLVKEKAEGKPIKYRFKA